MEVDIAETVVAVGSNENSEVLHSAASITETLSIDSAGNRAKDLGMLNLIAVTDYRGSHR
jgi:hypothetical protein